MTRDLPTATAPRCFALLPCAGTGSRSGAAMPKQYVRLAGQALVAHTLAAFAKLDELAGVMVVLAPDDTDFESAVGETRCWVSRTGGSTRAQTVRAGLDALRRVGAGAEDWVLVHDAARCLVSPDAIRRLMTACLGDPSGEEVGGLLAWPLADTLKQAVAAEDGARVAQTVPRQDKWLAQTPQMFPLGLLIEALDAAGDAVTDESSAIEFLGLSPRLVQGELSNFKVTYPDDFVWAEHLLTMRR